jgi:hypothetical protein
MSMCLDATGFMKDNLIARKDLAALCDRPSREAKSNARGKLSRAKAPYYFKLYLYTNMVKVKPYFEKFDKTYWTSRVQPTLKQMDHMHEHGLKGGPSFLKWFQQHVIYFIILFLSIFYFIHPVKCVLLCIPSFVVYRGCQCLQ